VNAAVVFIVAGGVLIALLGFVLVSGSFALIASHFVLFVGIFVLAGLVVPIVVAPLKLATARDVEGR
jgi:hypothetical protein